MKDHLYRLAKRTGLFALCRWLTRRELRVLCYHGVWMGEGHFGNFLFVSPEKFAQRMRTLERLGFPVLGLGEALQRREKGTLPENAVAITIDDGWYSTYVHMLPVLERHQFPSTVYMTTYYSEKRMPVLNIVVRYMVLTAQSDQLELEHPGSGQEVRFSLAGPEERERTVERLQAILEDCSSTDEARHFVTSIGQKLGVSYDGVARSRLFDLMSADEIADCATRGMSIQLHTHRHRIEHDGHLVLKDELKRNRDSLAPLARERLEHFCYPSGEYDERAWPVLESEMIVSATTTDLGFVTPAAKKFALPRILDGQEVSELEFEAELCGVGEVKRRLARFVRPGATNKRTD